MRHEGWSRPSHVIWYVSASKNDVRCPAQRAGHRVRAMPIPIRPAEPRDIAAITRIYAHAVLHGTASFELDPPDEAEITRRYNALRDGGFPYLVAEIDGAGRRLRLCRALSGAAGLSLHRRGFDLHRSDDAAARRRARAAGAAAGGVGGARLPADDRGDRRFRRRRRRSSCTRRSDSGWSAPSRRWATNSAAGSTAC